MFDLLHKLKKFFCQKRHEYLLKDLNAIFSKYKVGNPKELGKSLFKGDKKHEAIFKKYFKTYHFEKNFYTNYHAIHKLFDTYYQLIKIPKNIIYSHYIKKNENENEIKKAVEKEIKDIKSFSVSDVIQSNEPVPFPNYYYFIFKIENKIQTYEVSKTSEVFYVHDIQ